MYFKISKYLYTLTDFSSLPNPQRLMYLTPPADFPVYEIDAAPKAKSIKSVSIESTYGSSIIRPKDYSGLSVNE